MSDTLRGEAAVVVSFPRTGTHLTMDFVRRNFEEFRNRLLPWESSERLYYNLEIRNSEEEKEHSDSAAEGGHPLGNENHLAALRNDNFIVKTHDLAFQEHWMLPKLMKAAGNRRVTFLYPFRKMSRSVASFQAYQHTLFSHLEPNPVPEDLREFLYSRDLYFNQGATVYELMLRHAQWALNYTVPIDIDDLLARPEEHVEALAREFGWTSRHLDKPLPPKRVGRGWFSELIERVRGRASSEVLIPRGNLPAAAIEEIDEKGELAEAYRELKRRTLVPSATG